MTISRLAASAAVIVLVGAAQPLAARQGADDLYGRTVTEVHFEVDGELQTSSALEGLIDVQVGQPLTRENVRASMDHLFSLYEDVTPIAAPSPGGVSVTFRLVPRYPIGRVEVLVDEAGLSASVLRDEIRQRFGGVPTGVRTSTVEDSVRRLLNDEGYLNAEVIAQPVVQSGADSATLVVTVQAGPRTVIGRTEVQGSSPLTPEDVRRRTGIQTGQPFRRRQIDAELTVIEDELRSRGYYEAQTTLEASPSPGGVDLTINVDAGPRVELRVEPIGAAPGPIDELIPIRSERSADRDLLEDSQRTIERLLQSNGYASASATFSSELSQDGSLLVITFTIDRGPLHRVLDLELPESRLPAAVLRDLIGIESGDPFSLADYDLGMARVGEAYRLQGYYGAVPEANWELVEGRSTPAGAWVVLRPEIDEGPAGAIAAIDVVFEGPHELPEVTLRQAMQSQVGGPYDAQAAMLDQASLLALYRGRGFLSAAVEVVPSFSDDGRDVTLTLRVNEGPQVFVGRLTVVGNERVSTQAILEEAGLQTGEPLGEETLLTAQRRLLGLGVFRSVSVGATDRLSGETEAHVVIAVVEGPTVSGGFGGGLEGGTRARSAEGGGYEDHIEFSPRGFFEISRRSLGGRDRSISFFSRISLKPRTAPGDPENDGRGFGFAEYRVTGTYRERRAFRTETDLLLGVTSEQVVRTAFNFKRQSANAELLHRLTPRLSVSGRYALDFTRLFDERIPEDDRPFIDRRFAQVRLSILSSGVSWDGRDSILAPTRGAFVSADVEVAVRALASEVGYVKTFLQGSRFFPIDSLGRTIMAVRGQLGLARGFTRTVPVLDDDEPVFDANGEPMVQTVQDLPVSQRFFAGGGTTVRGFPLDRLGTVADPPEASVINPSTGLSVGGNSVIVLNAEVRRHVGRLFSRDLALVGFIDGGNVFPRVSDLDLSRIRGGTGFGVRYDSPLGPLRFDVGFKLNRLVIADKRERAWEYHLSIGEAF